MNIRADIRQMGFPGWLSYSAGRLLQRISGGRLKFAVVDFYLQPMGESFRKLPAPTSSIRVEPIGREQMDPEQFERRADVLDTRVAEESVCIAAMRNDELMGFMWLHFGVFHDRDLELLLKAGARQDLAWDFDMFIKPKYRLGPTFARLWSEAQTQLLHRGCTGTLSWVRLENGASRRAHARLGATLMGRAALLSLGRYQLTVSTIRPWLAVSTPDRPATLVIDG